jgi:hypothetical protein
MGRASRNDVTPRTSEGMRSNFNPPPALRARIRRFGEVGFLFALLPAVSRSLGAGSTRAYSIRVRRCASGAGIAGER